MTPVPDMPTWHRAAVLTADRVIERQELAVPGVGAHDVLVRVEATGICGSDLSTYRGMHPYKRAPVVLGHELCGTVVRRGAGVNTVEVGDRIVSAAFSPCDDCPACARGATNLCGARANLCHKGWDGSFAQYIRLRDNMIFRIDRAVDVAAAAMAEPLSIALHAVRLAGAMTGRTIAILGSGGIGLCAAMVARHLALGRIVCVDRGPAKAALVDAAGADHYVDVTTVDVEAGVLAWTRGGADVTFVAAGYGGVLDQARAITRPGGEVVVVSYFDGPHEVALNAFVSAELSVRFSALSTASDFVDVVGWLEDGAVDPRPLITHRFPVSDAANAMTTLDVSTGEVGKIMLCAE
jgi:2-desacetyl-2-hydroxyethyl bacteriochlorophyllide A dehydrogenase